MATEERTVHAAKALSLAQKFNIHFAGDDVETGTRAMPVNYKVEMVAPEGPSTGGGKQAVQAIKMVPTRGQTIVIGTANQVTGIAEVRTWEHLAQVHAQRNKGEEFPVPRGQYQIVYNKAIKFFGMIDIKVVKSDAVAEAKRQAGSSRTLLLGVALGVVLVTIVLLLIAMKK